MINLFSLMKRNERVFAASFRFAREAISLLAACDLVNGESHLRA